MKNLALRGLGVILTGALVGSMGLATSAQAAPVPVPAGVDPSPVALGAAYLAAQPGSSGLIHIYYSYVDENNQTVFGDYDDYGLTIDAALALDAVGGQGGKLNTMTDAVQGGVDAYANSYGTSANAAGKVAAFLTSRQRTGAAVDHAIDLVESTVSTSAPIGRIADVPASGDPNPMNYATPLGEVYAAQALKAAASPLAASVLDDLGKQQCTGPGLGYFRESFAEKVCNNDPVPVPSIDTTAIAILALQAQKSDTVVVAPMLAKAVEWLVAQQAANGSWNNGNANSTGLATWALGLSNRPSVVAKGAGWLRGHQLANAGSCAPYAAKDNGAIVLDDLGLANVNAGGPLSNIDNSVATRATAQALPGLIYAEGGAASGDTKLTVPTGYVRAGSSQALTIAGAPGNTVCVTNGATSTRVVLGAGGAGSVPVTMPNATVNTTLSTVDAGGETDSATFRALGAINVKVKVRGGARILVGRQAVIKVSGLAAGEAVKLKFRGVKAVSSVANASGKVTLRFKVTKVVRGNVKAIGAFPDRQGKTRLVVVRRR